MTDLGGENPPGKVFIIISRSSRFIERKGGRSLRQGGGGGGVELRWTFPLPLPLWRGSDLRDFFMGGGGRWLGCRGRRLSGWKLKGGGGRGGRGDPSIIFAARCLARMPPPLLLLPPAPARGPPRFLAAAAESFL